MGGALNQNCEASFQKPRDKLEFATPIGLSAPGRRKERNKRHSSGRHVFSLPNPFQLPWSL